MSTYRRHIPLVLALTTPFLTLWAYLGLISWDLDSFISWAGCLQRFSGAPYPPCSPDQINYPTIGLYASAGVVRLLQTLEVSRGELGLFFQIFLGIVDSLNILVMYLLMRGLRIPYAGWAALIFSVLPSTRVGGNLWAQIDGVSQLFLLAGFLFGLRGLKAARSSRCGASLRYFAGISLSIVGALLTKQLVIFSIPALVVMWTWLFVTLTKKGWWRSAGAISFGCFIAAVALDQSFPTPPGYLGSGLIYVLDTGSDHAQRVLHNGVSIYSLLPLTDTDPARSSYPLFSMFGIKVYVLPFYFGIAAFLTMSMMASGLGSLIVWKHRLYQPEQVTVAALALAAALNLFMNTVITGTHERYFYHYGFFAYPVLLVLSRDLRWARGLLAVAVLQLTVYGFFVYTILRGYHEGFYTLLFQHLTAGMNAALSVLVLLLLAQAAFKSRLSRTETTE